MRVTTRNLRKLNWIFFGIYVAIVTVLACQGLNGRSDGASRELRRVKPMFFSITFATVGLALMFPIAAKKDSQDSWDNLIIAATLFNICGVIDTTIIFIQQQRDVPSHFNHNGLLNQSLSFILSAVSFILLASVFFYILEFGKVSRRHSHITRTVGALSSLALAVGMFWGFLMIVVGYYQIKGGATYSAAVTLFAHDLRRFHMVLLLQFPIAILAARVFEEHFYPKQQANWISAAILVGAHATAAIIATSAVRYETAGP